jgi:hypothetical protein
MALARERPTLPIALMRPLALAIAITVFGCSSQEAAPPAIRCTSPLSSVCDAGPGQYGSNCPPEFPSELPGPWCASNLAGPVLGSCGGYVTLPVGDGVDVEVLYMYPADGGPLAAAILAVDGDFAGAPSCLGGSPDFALPTSCFPTANDDTTIYFDGPGALPGCSTFDAGLDAADASD